MSKDKLFASIIVDINNEAVDKAFLYSIKDEMKDTIKIGDKVKIPFGNGNKIIEGFVINIGTKEDILNIQNDEYLLKDGVFENAKEIIESAKNKISINNILMNIAHYMSEEYKCPLSLCLKTVLPVKKEVLKNKRQIDVIEKYDIIDNNIKSLTDEQNEVVNSLIKNYKTNKFSNNLLFGVTGSGKTEVFIKLIEEVIKDNKKVIVLIPEISLTYQTVTRLKSKFGNKVAILNSKMSAGEKYIQMKKCMDSEIDIFVGPRSALFAPFEDLGLIIIDEEDDKSYISDNSPRYNAIEVAEYRAKLQNAMLLTMSATPNINRYYRAKEKKEIILYTLTKRISTSLPNIEVVDMRKEYATGNKSVFSKLLKSKINDCLSKKEQVLLFMNRRGLNRSITCVSCGDTIKCPHCDIPLTVHNDGKIKCHYCGYEEKTPIVCPKCNSNKLSTLGLGTQKLEQWTIKEFPTARIIRMDKDTVTEKDSYDKIIKKFNNYEADIMIGTQMIVKGHDFPNVTLVGIMCADMIINIEGYNASENAFSQICQVAGRSGRKKIGECVIQTYDPDNNIFSYIKNNDYDSFYNNELSFRKSFNYPPIKAMLKVTIKSLDEDIVNLFASDFKLYIELNFININILGPVKPNPSKIKDYYYRVIYIKCDNKILAKEIRKFLYEYFNNNDKKKFINIAFDIEA